MNLETLMAEYRVKLPTLTQRELASMESRMWAMYAIENPGNNGSRRHWLAKTFGDAISKYEVRAALDSLGASVDLLWQSIDKGMPLRTGQRLNKQAKTRMALEACSFVEAVAKEVNEYYAGGREVKLSNGRRMALKKKDKKKDFIAKSITAAPKEGLPFTMAIEQLVSQEADKLCPEADAYDLKKAKEELYDWISEGLKTFSKRLNKLNGELKESKLYTKIGKTNFTDALSVLGLNQKHFTFGKPIDNKAVKKAYFVRSRALHPDRNPGENVRKEFEAVTTAFRLLEQYSEQLT